jgi:hypothetical protein
MAALRVALLGTLVALIGLTPAAMAASGSFTQGWNGTDPDTRTVVAGAFTVQWSATDPEEIVALSWKGSPNLTNTWAHPFCPQGGDSEFFGNSWGTDGGGNFRALVGWGSTGTWGSRGANGVAIASAANSGCFGTSGIRVETRYQFSDRGAPVNRILVKRTVSFGATPFAFDFRPYIPRLSRSSYTTVVHPDVAGSGLVREIGDSCEFGCEVTNWNGTWFAEHDPLTGGGMIVRRASSESPAALWIDVDGGSFTTASSVLLLQPAGGFTGTVNEVEFLCFYDAETWTPSLDLPAGC